MGLQATGQPQAQPRVSLAVCGGGDLTIQSMEEKSIDTYWSHILSQQSFQTETKVYRGITISEK